MQTKTNDKTSFSYEVLGNSSYLVAALQNPLINYQIEMLLANEIANILPVSKQQKNADIQLYYNVTSKISLTQAVVRNKLSKNNFLKLILGAINAFKEVDEYQLVNTGIVLEPELIFVKTGEFEPAFVYLPIFMVDEGIKRLREFIVSLILKDVIEVSNDNFVQVLLSRINSENLSITELEKIISELRDRSSVGTLNSLPLEPLSIISAPFETKPESEAEFKPKSANLPNIPTAIPFAKGNVNRTAQRTLKDSTASSEPTYQKIVMIGFQVLFLLSIIYTVSIDPSKVLGVLFIFGGIDFVLYRELFKNNRKPVSAPTPQLVTEAAPPLVQLAEQPKNIDLAAGSGDTVVLTENNTGTAYLEFFENGISNKIILNKPSILVGRFKGQVDYIVNNNTVGKIHAEFISREGNYFIKDYNSTNGSYINGSSQRITSNVEYQIKNNDKISLANCELILKC